jgi:hypothetical protein
MKKNFILPLFLVSILGCGQTKNEFDKKTVDKNTIALLFITNYYEKQYKTYKIQKSVTDTSIEISVTQSNATIGNHIIPKKINLTGDLNGDKKDDLIISVQSSGGGNIEWGEMFLFITKGDSIIFDKMYKSFDLAICPKNGSSMEGQFYAEEIKNSELMGESICYSKDDPHCCPSIKNKTTYKFNGLLKLVK